MLKIYSFRFSLSTFTKCFNTIIRTLVSLVVGGIAGFGGEGANSVIMSVEKLFECKNVVTTKVMGVGTTKRMS